MMIQMRKLFLVLLFVLLLAVSALGVTVVASGIQTAVITTEHVLLDTGTNSIFSASINLDNMASGDTTEIRIYKKVLTTSTQDLIETFSFSGAQTEKVFYIPHVSAPFG